MKLPRAITLVGVGCIVAGLSGVTMQRPVFALFGCLFVFIGWIGKPKSSPPQSVIGWLVFGRRTRSYEEMGEDELSAWESELERQVNRRSSTAGTIDSMMFGGLQKYSEGELEEELAACRAAMEENPE